MVSILNLKSPLLVQIGNRYYGVLMLIKNFKDNNYLYKGVLMLIKKGKADQPITI